MGDKEETSIDRIDLYFDDTRLVEQTTLHVR